MTMSDDQSADTPIFDSRRETLEPEAGLPDTVLPQAGDAPPYGGSAGGQSGVTEEAGRVAGSAVDAGKDVAATAKDQAKNVAGEAAYQAKDLYRQTREELREQAAQQQERVAQGLRSVGDELDQMASSSEQGGLASDLVRQAAQRTQSVARWLDQRDPGSLVEEVKAYARRNPGTFIAAAAIAGALAGRLTRALASGGDETGSQAGQRSTTQTAGNPTGAGYSGGDDDLYDDGAGNPLPEIPGAGYTGGRA